MTLRETGLLSVRCSRGDSLPREPRESCEPRGEPELVAKGAVGGSRGDMSVIRCLVDAACEIMELAADDGRLLLENVSNEKGRRRWGKGEGGGGNSQVVFHLPRKSPFGL